MPRPPLAPECPCAHPVPLASRPELTALWPLWSFGMREQFMGQINLSAARLSKITICRQPVCLFLGGSQEFLAFLPFEIEPCHPPFCAECGVRGSVSPLLAGCALERRQEADSRLAGPQLVRMGVKPGRRFLYSVERSLHGDVRVQCPAKGWRGDGARCCDEPVLAPRCRARHPPRPGPCAVLPSTPQASLGPRAGNILRKCRQSNPIGEQKEN